MEQQQQEQTPQAQNNASPQTNGAAKAPSNSYVHAVLKDKEHKWTKVKAKHRQDLSRMLAQDEFKDSEIVGIFKGKELSIKEKKSFSFS